MPVQFRPELHVTAETGVLNAPAGVLRDDDRWHVFYQFQHRPDAAARWGHVTSDDGPFDWYECNDALAPVGGETGIRAGTVIANGEGADLYFTSVTAAGTSIQLARLDSLSDSTEVSDEATTVDEHVERLGVVVSDGSIFRDFRSPCVVADWATDDDRDAGHEGWLMLAVTGPVDDPVPVILSSPDQHDWRVLGPLTFAGDHGLGSTTHLVAPRIIRLRDEVDGQIYDVLLITIESESSDISGYLVGQLEGATFTVTTGFTLLDYGYDFNRPRNTTFTSGTISEEQRLGEAVIFGTLNRAGRKDRPADHLSMRESDWANVLSLPRVLSLQGGRIFQTPYPGVVEAIASSSRARSWTGISDVPADGAVMVTVRDDDGAAAFTVTQTDSSITVDRTMNSYHSDTEPQSAPLTSDDTTAMTIIVDGSVVEVFANGGEAALASRVYIKGGHCSFEVTASGGATVERTYENHPVID